MAANPRNIQQSEKWYGAAVRSCSHSTRRTLARGELVGVAEPLEVVVEADTYDAALADARAQVAEGDDLLSVQTLIP